MEKTKSSSIYYDINETLTHNCLFNFVCGNRSAGKTYGFKRWAIRDYLRNGNQFGYIRRYESEIDKGKLDKFFDDILWEFPEWEFKVNGLTFLIREKLSEEDQKAGAKNNNKWETIGFCFILSKAMTFKSVPYPRVSKVLFDEFLIEKGVYRYLPNEVDKFNELYVTIARPGSEHCDVIAFFMSNAITFTNIYFLAFDIKPPQKGKSFYKVKGKEVLLQMVSKENMIERQKNTRYGKIIAGTKYAEYAFENKFYLDDSTFIQKRSEDSRHVFVIRYLGTNYGFWFDYNAGLIFVSERYDPCCKAVYVLQQSDHNTDTIFIKSYKSAYWIKLFVEAYKAGDVRFDSMKVKNMVYDMMKIMMLR